MSLLKKNTFAAGITLVIVSIITIAVLSFRQSRKVDVVSSRIEHTRSILLRLNNLYSSIIEHAGAARNFALNGGQEDIQLIRSTASTLLLKLEQLNTLVIERPGQRIQFDSLARYITKRIDFSEKLITKANEEGSTAAAAQYQSGIGREYNNTILSFIQKMQADELNILQLEEEKNIDSIKQLNYYLAGLLVFILILILILVQKGRSDIALRKKTEEHLKSFNLQLQQQVNEKAAELTGVFERITDGFIALDKNFCFTYVNKRAGEMTGRDPDLFIGKNIWKEFEKNISPQFRDAVLKAMKEQEYIYFAEYSAAYDCWFEDHLYPSPEGLSIFYRDISERKKTELALKNSEETTRLIMNAALDAIICIDTRGTIIVWTSQAEEIFGWTEKQVLGKKLADTLIPAKYRDEHRRGIEHYLRTGQGPILNKLIEITALNNKGDEFPVELTIVPIKKNGTEFFCSFIRDISERKKAAEELRISRENLERSYKEIRLLASNIENIREQEKIKIAREIHDELGQQLTGLKMDVSWLGKKLNPEQSMLHQKTEEILLLVDEAVRSVRRIASELRPGLLDDLGLIAALEWQSEEFEKRSGIKVVFRSPVNDAIIPSRVSTGLFRIYQESLTNVARHAQAHKVFSTLEQKGGEFVLQITDDGIGFDAKEIANKKTLGLLGMKERTMMMGGRYEIISEPGEGTTVIVAVPLSENTVGENS